MFAFVFVGVGVVFHGKHRTHEKKEKKKTRTNVLDHDALGVVDLALQLRDVVRAGVRVVVLLFLVIMELVMRLECIMGA